MKNNLAVAFVVICGLLTITVKAQTESSAFTLTGSGIATPFARDYQCLGINPANLDLAPAYEGKRFSLGFAEFGLSLYSEVLTKPELRQNLFNEKVKNFSQSEQIQYAKEFANATNVLNADVMSTGFSVQTNKLGSFAFSTRDRINFFSQLGPQVSELLWLGYTAPYFEQLVLDNGDTIPNTPNLDSQTLSRVVHGITALQNAQNLTQLIQGTHIRFSWIREFNFGYGKRIWKTDNLELHGGVGLKLLIGQGLLDVDAEGGKAVAFGALSPVFQIDYGDTQNQNPSALSSNAKPLTPVGRGFGVDIGTTLILKNRFTVSAAITDIGSMTWDGNLYQLKDIKLTDFDNSGLESVNFYDQINQLNGSNGLLDWQGATSIKTTLPTTARFGFGMNINNKLKAGVDLVSPLNDAVGSLDKVSVALGGEFSPVRWVHLSAGFMQGGNYGTKIPAGVTFTIGGGAYECGVASRDLITYFTDNQPTISLTTGFLRFHF